MEWGFFSIAHIISLVLAVAINTGLYFLLKRTGEKIAHITLFVLSFSGIAAIIFNLVAWGSPLEYLPFHLCSINALMLPIAVITRNRTINNLLLLWSLGAFFALILNVSVAEAAIGSATFMFYYFPHVLEAGIPIIMFKLGLVKLDARCTISTLIITMSSYTVIHFINLLVNHITEASSILTPQGEVVSVNYMFSLRPENPLLDLFYSIIPHQYWYMYMIIPIVALYLGTIYGINYLIERQRMRK